MPEVESRLFSLRDFFAVLPEHCDVITQIVLFGEHRFSAVAERKLFWQFVNYGLGGTHVFLTLKKNEYALWMQERLRHVCKRRRHDQTKKAKTQEGFWVAKCSGR